MNAQFEEAVMMQNASLFMQELELQEQKLLLIQMAQTKIIKCNYCGHKGQSMVEETTSVISYLVIAIIVMVSWDWQIASSWIYPLSFLLCIFPIVAGFFRI